MSSAPEIIWRPTPEAIESSRMTAYTRWPAAERRVEMTDYDGLWHWSVENLEDFWRSIWDYFDVQASGNFDAVLTSHEMPGARWFEGAELNYAEHIFLGKDDEEVALLHASELASWARSPGVSCAAPSRRWPRGCGRSASAAATALPPTSPTRPRS